MQETCVNNCASKLLKANYRTTSITVELGPLGMGQQLPMK